MKTLIAIFPTKEDANETVKDLNEFGFEHSDISVVMKKNDELVDEGDKGGRASFSGIFSGVASGGVLGGLAGLLIGIGAITVPGAGAIFIAGPIATALGLTGAAAATVSGAATGALAGGVVGGLVDLGLSRETAKEYEERINRGGVLLAVPVRSENDNTRIRRLFDLHNADYINMVESR